MIARSPAAPAVRGSAAALMLVLAIEPVPQEPTLRIVEPAAESRLPGSEVAVRLAVEGAELGGQARNGAHVLLTLDELPPLKSLAERFVFRGVAPGQHELRAELRRRDGSAFTPPVVARVRFVVQATER